MTKLIATALLLAFIGACASPRPLVVVIPWDRVIVESPESAQQCESRDVIPAVACYARYDSWAFNARMQHYDGCHWTCEVGCSSITRSTDDCPALTTVSPFAQPYAAQEPL